MWPERELFRNVSGTRDFINYLYFKRSISIFDIRAAKFDRHLRGKFIRPSHKIVASETYQFKWGWLLKMPITVAWTVFARLNAGIVDSNSTQGIDVCVRLFCVCIVLCVGSGPATGWSPVQEVLPTVYRITEMKKRPRSNKRTLEPQIDSYLKHVKGSLDIFHTMLKNCHAGNNKQKVIEYSKKLSFLNIRKRVTVEHEEVRVN
jgi:hypothetical protein